MSSTSDTRKGTRQPHCEKASASKKKNPQPAEDQEREEEAECARGLNPACGPAPLSFLCVLSDVRDRAAVLPAERQALQQAQRHEKSGCRPADAANLA